MEPPIDVSDLLGVQYRRGETDPSIGLDCRTAAQLVAGRIPALAGASLGLGEDEAFMDLTADGPSWALLGREACRAKRAGDLVLTDAVGAHAGLAVLVDPGARLFLTSTPARGVHLVPGRALSDVVGVYRRKGA